MNKKELQLKVITIFFVIVILLLFFYLLSENLSMTSTNVYEDPDSKEGVKKPTKSKDDGVKTSDAFLSTHCNGTYYGTIKTIDGDEKLTEERKATIILFNNRQRTSGKYYFTDTYNSYDGYYYTTQNNKIYMTINGKKEEFVASDECDIIIKKEVNVDKNLTTKYKLNRVS